MAMRILCLTMIALCAGAVGWAAEPEPLFSPPEYQANDAEVFAQFRNEVEAAVKQGDRAAALDITRGYDGKFLSPSANAKALEVMGRLHMEAAQREEAKAAFQKAWESYSDTGPGLAAANQLLLLLKQEMDYTAAARIAQRVVEKSHLTPRQEVYFAGRLGECLVATGNIQEGVAVVNEVALKYPLGGKDAGGECENIAVTAMNLGQKSVYYDEMQWIVANLPQYAESSRFIGNLAHACQETGRFGEAIAAYLRVIQDYPDDARTADFLLEAGGLLMDRGDMEAGIALYGRLFLMDPADEHIRTLQAVAHERLRYATSRGRRAPNEEWLLDQPRKTISFPISAVMTENEDVKAPAPLLSNSSAASPEKKSFAPPSQANEAPRSAEVQKSEGTWWKVLIGVCVAGLIALGLYLIGRKRCAL